MREKPECCDCCGYETAELNSYANRDTTIGGGGKTVKEDFWFCDLCAGTMTSTFYRFPGQVPSNAEVMKVICFVGNRLLAAKEGER